MLLKMKKDQRQQELDQFKSTINNKNDLFKELKELDSQAKATHQIQQMEENFDLENLEGHEYDKRLAMYKKLREQLQGDISKLSQ